MLHAGLLNILSTDREMLKGLHSRFNNSEQGWYVGTFVIQG